jgi:hypothetical protein
MAEQRQAGALLVPRDVRAREHAYLRKRREAAGVAAADGEWVGLALSGGGIRSATFAFGVLQTLARRDLLRAFDYLCTVSGGGYIGACVSSLLTETGGDRPRSFDLGAGFPLLQAHQIHHLRKHGDFLIARQGLFRREALRAIGTSLLGIVCSLALFAALVVVAAGALLVVWCLLGGERGAPWHAPPFWGVSWVVLGAALGVLCRKAPADGPIPPLHGETAADWRERRLLVRFAIWLGVAMLVAIGVSAAAVRDSALLLPACVPAGAAAGLAAGYLLRAGGSAGSWNRQYRSTVGAMLCIAGLAIVGWALLIATVPLAGWIEAGLGASLTVVGPLALALTRLGALQGRPRFPWLRHIALALAVPLLLASSLLGVTILARWCGLHWWVGAQFAAAGAVAFVLIGYLVDFNRISPHYFYRDRLADAYLRTEALRGHDLQVVRDDYALRLADLHARTDGDNPAPYHLILCALNLPGSRDLARKDRKSDHFVFAREFCGSSTTGWVPTAEYDGGRVKLCKAMTISGAAASSLMGFYTSFTRAFAMTLFNVRLGYWLPNPRHAAGCIPTSDGAAACGIPRPVSDRPFWPAYLLRELTASTHGGERRIHLSDGGHCGDNLGLYPLLQRRCKLIVVCDAERDPDHVFGSLAAAIRQIFTDENVVVRIDLDALRRRAEERPEQHFAVGSIAYPDCPEDPDNGTAHGWLVYLKASFLDRDEPATVKSYATRHADFPHETTADQFFDDDQFESYRALGAHIAERVFDSVGAGATAEVRARLLQWCERHGTAAAASSPPQPDDEAARLRAVLEKHRWVKVRAARELGWSRRQLDRAMGELGLERPESA